jgi:hypothetical protein
MATTPSAPNVYLLPLAKPQAIEYLWYAPSVNGNAVTNYELTLEPGPLVYTLSTINRYRVTGLTNGQTYSASIRATCNYPDWGPSASFFEFQPGNPPPTPPISAIVTVVSGSTNAMVSWQPPSASLNATIFWYVIKSKSNNPSDPVLQFTASGLTQRDYYITGLNMGSTYSFSIEGVNCPGYSPQVSTNAVYIDYLYSPLLVDGIQLWLDAQDRSTLTFIQSSITQWNDKSGNARNATPYQTLYPTSTVMNLYPAVGIYSNAAIRAPMTSGVTSSRIFSFIVFQKTGLGSSQSETIIARTNGGQPAPIDVYNNTRYRGDGTGANNLLTSPMSISSMTTTTLYDFTATANLWQEWRNASNIMSNTTASAFGDNSSFIYFGDRADSATTFTGSIGEIIVYNSNLTPFDREKTEGYLAWKWGIQSTLPIGHPFYSAPPYYSTIFNPTPYVSGIKLWYDGADPLGTGTPPAAGTSITTWIDKSGLSNNATAGVAATYVAATADSPGYPLFNGTSTYYNLSNTSFINNQQYMLFIVDQVSSYTTGTPHILNGTGGTNSNLLVRYTGANPISIDYTYVGTASVYNLLYLANSNVQPTRVWSLVQTATNRQIYFNGTLGTNDAWTPLITSWAGAEIGRQGAGNPNNYYKGGIKEILFVTGVPDDDNRQTIEGYLCWKWGTQGIMSSSHPYKTINPGQLIQPFQPNLIAGLTMWGDAADFNGFYFISSNIVGTWVNKVSLNTNNFGQGAAPNRPTRVAYGSSYAVQFKANLTSLIGNTMSSYFPNNARTIFIVASADTIGTDSTTIGNNVALIGGLNSGIRFGMYFRSTGATSTYGVYNYDTTIDTITLPYTIGQLEIFQYEFGGGTLGARLTGGTAATIASGNTGTMTTSVALGLQNSSYNFDGKMMEVLIYDSALNTTNRQNVEGYLAWKWNLVSKLPSNHPYKNTPVPGFKA